MRRREGMRRSAFLVAWALLSAAGGVAAIVPPEQRAPAPATEPMQPPESSTAVESALEAPFLTAEEAKDLRVRFGRATSADLDSPARASAWAVLNGAYLDAALEVPEAPALDRAEALVWRGAHEEALRLIEQDPSMRGVRVRVRAYYELGRRDMAIASALAAQQFLSAGGAGAAGGTGSATEIADAARAVAMVTRLRRAEGAPGSEHQALMAALKRAREELDRLAWPVHLAEAELLYEKDNSLQSQQALQQVLAMNPRCAEAWALLGRMAVEAFDMDSAEAMATRLDMLAGAVPPEVDGEIGPAPEGWEAGPASPMAAIVRARAMLRQNDPEQAAGLASGAMAAYPGSVALSEMRCAITALRFDAGALDRALEEHEARAPGSAGGLYEAGRALSEARQYAQASHLLRRAVSRSPHWARPLIDLGLLYIQSGEDEDALEVLSDAVRMDPFNVRADNSLKLVREVSTYERVESEHFIVRFRGKVEGAEDRRSADGVVAREMLPVLEENHRQVCTAPEQVAGGLDYEPANKTLIDLMPNHRWFAVRIAGMPRIHTIAASTGPVIAMEAPREGQSHSGTYDWPRVIRHEYVHTVGLGKTSNRLPHWFTEAQAVYLERSPRDYATVQLLARVLEAEELFDFVEINAAFVRPKKPTDRQQAYAQGHWMYQYLVETFGDRAPLKLMELYGQGVREDEAYQRVLSISREEFMTRFKAWAREQLVSWGMARKPGQPPLEELLEPAQAPAGEGGEAKPPQDRAGGPSVATLQRLLEQHPEHADLLELTCRQALERNGGMATLELAPLLERYSRARPVDPMPHKALARLYLSLPEPAEGMAGADGAGGASEGPKSPRSAIPHLEWLDAREEKSPVYASQLAALYAVAGDFERAWAKALRATRVSPYDARYREKAAAIALQRSDLASAKAQIEAMIVLEPDRAIHKRRLEAIMGRMGS
ncbi:MAG: tetratricopeptide repeat protein [Phycisphaerales bacterium]